MKTKSLFLVLLILTGLTSCKQGACIRGEGDVVTQSYELPPIDGFSLCIGANVNLTQGETQSVSVTGQQNILNQLTLDVSGTTWTIGLDSCTSYHDQLVIDITLPSLALVDISGSGDVKSTNAFSNQRGLDLDISGSGSIDLNLEGGTINSNISGSGDITLAGRATSINQDIMGSGSLEAFDLPCTKAVIDIAGSGSAELTVSGALEVDILGSGDVYYKGKPTMDVNIAGSGEIIHKD